MRTTELWEVRCVCGADISSAEPSFRCRTCGRHGIIERPDCLMRGPIPPDDTLSAKEEAA